MNNKKLLISNTVHARDVDRVKVQDYAMIQEIQIFPTRGTCQALPLSEDSVRESLASRCVVQVYVYTHRSYSQIWYRKPLQTLEDRWKSTVAKLQMLKASTFGGREHTPSNTHPL